MPTSLPPLVERLVERLIRAFHPERVMLFGSFAKGMAHADSDIDLLLIAHAPEGTYHYRRRARQLAAGCFPPVDIVIATPAEIEEAPTASSPFLQSILGTGIVLYDKNEKKEGGGPEST